MYPPRFFAFTPYLLFHSPTQAVFYYIHCTLHPLSRAPANVPVNPNRALEPIFAPIAPKPASLQVSTHYAVCSSSSTHLPSLYPSQLAACRVPCTKFERSSKQSSTNQRDAGRLRENKSEGATGTRHWRETQRNETKQTSYSRQHESPKEDVNEKNERNGKDKQKETQRQRMENGMEKDETNTKFRCVVSGCVGTSADVHASSARRVGRRRSERRYDDANERTNQRINECTFGLRRRGDRKSKRGQMGIWLRTPSVPRLPVFPSSPTCRRMRTVSRPDY